MPCNFPDSKLVKVEGDESATVAPSGVREGKLRQTFSSLETLDHKSVHESLQVQQIKKNETKITKPMFQKQISKDDVNIVQNLEMIEVSLKSPQDSELSIDEASSEVTIEIPQRINMPDVTAKHEIRLKEYEVTEITENIKTLVQIKEFSTHTEETSALIRLDDALEGIVDGTVAEDYKGLQTTD